MGCWAEVEGDDEIVEAAGQLSSSMVVRPERRGAGVGQASELGENE